MMRILGVDIGTTSMKMGVFDEQDDSVTLVRQFSQEYPVNTYNDGLFSDIEPEKWQQAFVFGCKALGDLLATVDAVALSGTTPGFTAMDAEGKALYPAILMLDQRSRQQAQRIIDVVGMKTLLDETANMPVAGGCSLASLLWIKDNLPEVYAKDGRLRPLQHLHGQMAHRILRHRSLLGIPDGPVQHSQKRYDLERGDRRRLRHLAWNGCPRSFPAQGSPGRLRPELASRAWADAGAPGRNRGQRRGPRGLLARYRRPRRDDERQWDLRDHPGLPAEVLPLPELQHPLPRGSRPVVDPLRDERPGGRLRMVPEACSAAKCPSDTFYGDFMPGAVDGWLERESGVTYIPYLMGSRYSLDPLRAEFLGLTQETSREEMLAALVRGLCLYQREHLKEIALEIPLKDEIRVTGGALNPSLIRAKARWMHACRYVFEEQSSLKGAALLGTKHLQSISGHGAPGSLRTGGPSRVGAAGRGIPLDTRCSFSYLRSW